MIGRTGTQLWLSGTEGDHRIAELLYELGIRFTAIPVSDLEAPELLIGPDRVMGAERIEEYLGRFRTGSE